MRFLKRFLRSPVILCAIFFSLGIGIGYFSAREGVKSTAESAVTRQGGYSFINPLLSCDVQEDTPYPGFGSLRNKLQSQISAIVGRGAAKRISIYFRDMNTGYWTGVDQNGVYTPASLLKVPLLISYLHDAQTGDRSLGQQYTIPGNPDANAQEHFKPQKPLQLGNTYSINDLLRAMIEQSDNNAAQTLLDHVSQDSINDVYQNFGVPVVSDLSTDTISPVDYMRFLRILYNSTYLDRSHSQQALQMLAQIDFPQGAVRGIPPNVPFANKFGERTIVSVTPSGETTGQRRELADCGIVYYPRTPYGICIMTEGTDFTVLADAIAQLSKTTYDAVNGGLLSN